MQLDLITDLLGTPRVEDMRHACGPARQHVLRQAPKAPAVASLSRLSSQATEEAVHLLLHLLVFNPVSYLVFNRVSASSSIR